MSIKVGEKIPEGTFKYVPYTPELENGVSRISSNSRNLQLISQISSSSVVFVSDRESHITNCSDPTSILSHGVVDKRMEGEESCPFLCPWGFHGVYLISDLSENAITNATISANLPCESPSPLHPEIRGIQGERC